MNLITTCSKLGGIDIISKCNKIVTIQTVGGFDKYLNLLTNDIVICNIVAAFFKNKIIQYDTFKDVYYVNDKIDTKYFVNFINTINNICLLPFNCNDPAELSIMIANIYNAPNKQIFNAFDNTLQLIDSMKPAIKHLFIAYKIFIEKLIEIFIFLRNKYLDDEPDQINDKNDFNMLIEKWVAVDIENKINTSSLILYFNFPPKNITIEKSIKRIKYKFNGTSSKSMLLQKLMNEFMKESKKNNFYYCGFCPFIPLERFKLLLKFPIDKLIHIIKLLDSSNTYYKQINKITTNIFDITRLNIEIRKINNITDFNIIKKKHPQLLKKTPGIKQLSNTDKQQYIKFFESYICLYLDLYKQVTPHFIKKEKKICDLVVQINKISKEVINISNNIILKE